VRGSKEKIGVAEGGRGLRLGIRKFLMASAFGKCVLWSSVEDNDPTTEEPPPQLQHCVIFEQLC